MSKPTSYYLYERGLLHQRNAQRLLASPTAGGQAIVNELLSMVKYLEMGVQKQREEIADESAI